MAIFKTYSEFVNESFFSDEISKFSKKAIKAIKKFVGRGADYLNSLVYQVTNKRSEDGREGTIPIGVTIFPSDYDIQRLAEIGITAEKSELPSMNEESEAVEEEKVPLDFPNQNAGIINVNTEKMQAYIKKVIKYADERPLMIWGAPGIGKTTIVRDKLREILPGGRLIDLQLTTYMPEDFFLPVVDQGDVTNKFARRASRVVQGWLPMYHEDEGEAGDARANGPDGQGGLIFLDELSRANQSIRNVCLRLVLDRELDGGWKLGSAWRIVAASNRQEDDETNTAEFGAALGNRFQQINYVPTVKEFSAYAMRAKSKSGEEIFDPRMIAFLNWTKGQDFFHKLDPAKSSTIFPSPRSWEAAAIAWKNLKAEAQEENREVDPDDIYLAVSANVGKEAADVFMGFLELSNKIDLDALKLVYTSPQTAPLPPKRQGQSHYELDSAFIVASAIAYEARGKRLSVNEIENLLKYCVRVSDPTVAMQILQAVLDIHPYINAPTGSADTMINDFIRLMGALFLPAYPGSQREVAKIMAASKPGATGPAASSFTKTEETPTI